MLAYLDHEPLQICSFGLYVEFFTHVDSSLECLQLLLTEHFDRVSELEVLTELLVDHVSCFIVLFELRFQLMFGKVLVLVNFGICLTIGQERQVPCRVTRISLFQQCLQHVYFNN